LLVYSADGTRYCPLDIGATRSRARGACVPRLLILLFEAPGEEVAGVEGNAEEIRRNKTELGGANTDDTDDGAIDGGNDPALPQLLAEQDGAENSQNAGDVIQSNVVGDVQHISFMSRTITSGTVFWPVPGSTSFIF
jgi:hypothetical protein